MVPKSIAYGLEQHDDMKVIFDIALEFIKDLSFIFEFSIFIGHFDDLGDVIEIISHHQIGHFPRIQYVVDIFHHRVFKEIGVRDQ